MFESRPPEHPKGSAPLAIDCIVVPDMAPNIITNQVFGKLDCRRKAGNSLLSKAVNIYAYHKLLAHDYHYISKFPGDFQKKFHNRF